MQAADAVRKMCQLTGITVRHVTKSELSSPMVEHGLVLISFDRKLKKMFVVLRNGNVCKFPQVVNVAHAQ